MAQLLIIDAQNDFMDVDGAALPVSGATADTKRLVGLIDRAGKRITATNLTFDTHREFDIAHAVFWRDRAGNQPAPMTMITAAEIRAGEWTPAIPKLRDYVLAYASALEASGQYVIMVWPTHCVLGTWGHELQADLATALARWGGTVNRFTKGLNPLTEHYGAVRAEVPVAGDAETAGNPALIAALSDDDEYGIGGQASSHCVRATVLQIAEAFPAAELGKFTLLTDAMSPVRAPGVDFPAIADAFLAEMRERGMRLATTAEFLA